LEKPLPEPAGKIARIFSVFIKFFATVEIVPSPPIATKIIGVFKIIFYKFIGSFDRIRNIKVRIFNLFFEVRPKNGW